MRAAWVLRSDPSEHDIHPREKMSSRLRCLRMLVALLALIVVARVLVPEKKRADAARAVDAPDCGPANYSTVFFKKNSKA